MADHGSTAVQAMIVAFRELLQTARDRKGKTDIEPPLTLSDFDGALHKLGQQNAPPRDGETGVAQSVQSSYAVIETAVRSMFYELLASRSIEAPDFIQVWNLLDIISILADEEQCEPGLIFWLIEELLDSQTIDGCRTVFDYLESRRERITAKHFSKKSLIILRSCNELLRRLSRAENTVFCGRVFIFLFQSFPLGDKSSVNLRGEFHAENTTTFEDLPAKQEAEVDPMDVDQEVNGAVDTALETEAAPAASEAKRAQTPTDKTAPKAESPVTVEPTREANDDLDLDGLYPIFWSLQRDFSNPTRLFDAANFETFKKGLSSTIEAFTKVQKTQAGRPSVRGSEGNRRGIKRKRGDGDDDLASGFNPKYLTSRDLFELEMSDLAFRRHILVQTLILIDFLLSLRRRIKAKLADSNPSNKSVLYAYTLSEDDAKWANEIRVTVASYLQEGPDGKFYYRMVDTVLCRDKNWVRWKAESCPVIGRPPISAQDVVGAKSTAARVCAPRRLRATPLGSLDLNFLSEADPNQELAKLKAAERYRVPDPQTFEALIAEDEFDIGMAKDEEEKQLATNAKASKCWRALRVASKRRLNVFDKIDNNAQNLQALFKTDEDDLVRDREPDSSESTEVRADKEISSAPVVASSGSARDGREEPAEAKAVLPVEIDSLPTVAGYTTLTQASSDGQVAGTISGGV